MGNLGNNGPLRPGPRPGGAGRGDVQDADVEWTEYVAWLDREAAVGREPEPWPSGDDERWDPELEASIAHASGRIAAFHVCDWLVPTTDLVLDRGMMGDGVIDIPAIRGLVQEAGYNGFVEVEIMSARNWWLRDPDEVLSTMKARFAASA